MKRFLSRWYHWLLLLLIAVNLIMGITPFTSSKQEIAALIFGMVGFAAVLYLCIHIEFRKKKENS